MSQWVSTTCMRCAVGCGHLQRGVNTGYGLDLVRGDTEHPTNRGLACRRGIRETANPAGEWLTKPLVRKDGELVSTTWDVALSRVGERFENALSRSRDAIAVLGSGQQTNEAVYALGKFARGVVGTRYYDANTTLCMASAVAAYYRSFGSDAPPPTYEDIPKADSHVVWGANPAVAHPVLFRWIRESAGPENALCVVDPVRTKTAEKADFHVRPSPGGDLALARAVLAQLVETNRVDDDFIRTATTGFSDLTSALSPVESAASDAGVTTETVEQLASAFDRKTLLYWGMGVNQSVRGTATARSLIDLCLATGNLRPGSGPFSLTGQANSMGSRVCSSKGTWPGHRSFDAPVHRATVADHWGVPQDRLPDDTGPGPVDVIEAIETGPVEAVYCVATNPVAGFPDSDTVRKRLDDSFLVVQDAFRTETTDIADVVLPAATWGESNGTVMNMERTVSRVRASTETPSGVRQDINIIAAIAEQLAPDILPQPPVDPKEVFDEFRTLTTGTPADCSGISYDRLEKEHAVRWPAPTTQTSGGYRYYTGSAESERTWSFPTSDGRARFSSDTTGTPLPESVDDAYPLVLTTGRTEDGYNTGVRSRSSPDALATLVARVNPNTLAEYDVTHDTDTGHSTRVESRRGSVPVQLKPDPSLPEGTVWLPIHHPQTNRLTVPETDPVSDEPNYKQCAVRLHPCESHTESQVEGDA